jgi:hypothetical protein
LNKDNERFNYFIIYYRRLNNFNEENDMINIQDYKQVLVEPKIRDNGFIFRVKQRKKIEKK